VRALTFLPQTTTPRVWAKVDVRGCLVLFFIGFVKKACISENVAPIADQLFAAPDKFDAFGTWIGVLFYAIQIYCDFSGYTDMAIASARLLGYELTPNFNFPYFAASVADFWRRWHISLSTWLRDYLYIPLGGNRGSKWFTWRNLMLTMLLGGLWHGASWNFVLWGALHGIALIVCREWERLPGERWPGLHRLVARAGPFLTFFWICITWIFFRAQPIFDEQTHVVEMSGFSAARTVLDGFLFFENHGSRTFTMACLWFFLGLALIHWLAARGVFSTWWRRLPAWAFAAVLGCGVSLAILFVPAKYKPFIYFQF
jgi:alginate O-acetyltransferase complex protein AlgI